MTKRPSNWADANGLPSAHLLRAALRAGVLIDPEGSSKDHTHSSYRLHPSDAEFSPDDLRLGEELLVDFGLAIERNAMILPTPELDELLRINSEAALLVLLRRALLFSSESLSPNARFILHRQVCALAEETVVDPAGREAFLLELGRKFDQSASAAVGVLGEEFVVTLARRELETLGRSDLAAHVFRLSALTDDLGYDVVAPKVDGNRRLEVKTSAFLVPGTFHFFISRGEFEWGMIDEDWALIACRLDIDAGIELVGHCRASTLKPYLPRDGDGSTWTSAELEVPDVLFDPRLPPVV